MLKKICDMLAGLLITFLAIVAALLILPRCFGFVNLAVLSGSMEPNIPVGSVVFVKDVEPDTLEADDVITYTIGNGTMVTHRVVEVDVANQAIITKGDANETQDASPVAFSQVIGKMKAHIPLLGYISIYLKTPLGIAVGCGVLIIVILLAYLPDVFTKEENADKKDSKKKSQKEE